MSVESHCLRIVVVSPGQLGEVGACIAEALEANGHQVHQTEVGSSWPAAVDLVVSFGPMAPMDDLFGQLNRVPKALPVVLWYTEPLPPPSWPNALVAIASDLRGHWQRGMGLAKRVGIRFPESIAAFGGRLRACAEMRELNRRGSLQLLAGFTIHHEQLFRAWGLPAVSIPMGYSPRFGHLMGIQRDIDVAFIGSTRDKRRGSIVGELTRQFADAGLKVVIKDGSVQHGHVFGAERAELLNRTKILLSIMRQPWDDPIFRILLAAPNGAMVLSEPVRDSGPFIPGRHFVMASLDEIFITAQHYLQSEAERQKIADAAHQFVTNEVTMAAMADRLLQEWENRAVTGLTTANGRKAAYKSE